MVVPQLYDDTSYGRTLGQAGLFYSSPRRARRTGRGFTGYAEPPTFNVAGGLYVRPLTGETRSQSTFRRAAPSAIRSTAPTRTNPPDLHRTDRDRNQYGHPRAHLSRRRGGLADRLRNVFDFRVSHNAGRLPDDRPGKPDQRGIRRVRLRPERRYLQADAVDQDRNLRPEELVPRMAGIQRRKTASFRFRRVFASASWVSIRWICRRRACSSRRTANSAKSEFDYALFDDRPFTTYKSFVLRNGGQDGLFTRVMDGLEARLIDQAEAHWPRRAWKPVIVYINGQYWGHYNMRERGRGHGGAARGAGSNRRTSTCCDPTASLPRRSSRARTRITRRSTTRSRTPI